MKKTLRFFLCIAAALLMALVPGMDLAIERNLRPDGVDLFGYLYQLTGRTFASADENRLTLALLMVACLWLSTKYLFHKPKHSGIGEYLLCVFLGIMMLLATAVRTQNTVSVLWANLFQLAKAGMYLAGIFLLFLLALRALRQLLFLHTFPASATLRYAEEYENFWSVSGLLTLAWLPHMIARYPGVLMWDSYMQIKQFVGEGERWSNHPPFGTLLYGCVAMLGEMVGNRNLIYFLFTLVQCAAFIAVLSYSLCVMRRQGVEVRLRLAVLAVYAVSPAYAGWATVIAKDTTYQIALILLLAELLVFAHERESFLSQTKHLILFAGSSILMMLSRHNGAPVVGLVLAAMVCMMLRKNSHQIGKVVLCGIVSFAVAFGSESIISSALRIQDRYIQDVLSLPLQQTARVVSLHPEEIPQEERTVIDRVVEYDGLAENYLDWYADPVKDSYRQTASEADRAAYWKVWFRQMLRWPVDYLDAALKMNGILFDLNDNRPMYIGFTDMELHFDVYPYSFNDMSMYDREKLVPLDSAQRAFTEWYMDFDRIPLIGMMVSMSFHVCLLLMLVYLGWVERRRRALLVWLPALFTFGMCLFAPVVYLRYALPLIGSTPIGIAALMKQTNESGVKKI